MNVASGRYRIQAERAVWTLAVVTVLSAWTTSARSELILIDDFDDGNDDGWTHVDGNSGQPWGPTSFDASSGSYQLTTPGDVPVGGVGPALSFWDQSSDPMFLDGFVRAKVRTGNGGSNAGIFLRTSGDLETGLDGYAIFVNGRTDDENDDIPNFLMNRIVGTEIVAAIGSDERGFEFDEDWWIEAGVVGATVSMKFWRDGDPEPLKPQLSVTDPEPFTTGSIGVFSNIFADPAFPEPSPLSATFDDIYFTPVLPPVLVDNPGIWNAPGLNGGLPPGLARRLLGPPRAVPEPSAISVGCIAVAGLMILRRRHTKSE